MLHYEKRLLLLYLFWIIMLSPIILLIWHKEYLEGSFMSVLLFIKNFFLAYQFGASWFLGALIVGVPIVYGLWKLLGDRFFWIIPLIIYVYLYIKVDDKVLFTWYEDNIRIPTLSFPAGLFWIALGCLFSNNHISRIMSNMAVMTSVILFIVSVILGCIFRDFNYVFRIFSVFFIIILAFKLEIGHSQICKRLRIYSIHFFCIHYSLIQVLLSLSHHFGSGYLSENRWVLYILTLMICWCLSETMIRLKDIRGFKWLKYSM